MDVLNTARKLISEYADPFSITKDSIASSKSSVSLSLHGTLHEYKNTPDGSLIFTMRGFGFESHTDGGRPVIPHVFVSTKALGQEIIRNANMMIWLEARLNVQGTEMHLVDIQFNPLPSSTPR
jgi:hypothetical protein